jgi:dihydrodipicolinate synthase/N-acetylneuraminate lyase
VVCEGIRDAVEQAGWAREAGAQALDIMPPHHWLRFGFRPSHVIDYFTAVGEASGLPLIVHVYPAWTKASFSSELLAELARFPPEAHGRLAALAEDSQWLRAQRELAFTGDVEWIPTERYGPLDGERALAAARDALDLAELVIAGP